MINIIGGKFKKKKIEVPIKKVRPTSSIIREAIFSILESYALKQSINIYKEKCFIDLFAGSGAIGLEAISRGSAYAYFYEINKEVCEILNRNCKKICKDNEFKIYNQDSYFIKDLVVNLPVSAIFLDPPYEIKSFDVILENILSNNILDKNSFIIIETNNIKLEIYNNKFIVIKEKIYGKTKIIFLQKLF